MSLTGYMIGLVVAAILVGALLFFGTLAAARANPAPVLESAGDQSKRENRSGSGS